MNRRLPVAPALAAFALVAAGCQDGLPVDAAEKELLLRAADLVPFGYGFEDIEPHEVFSQTRYFDGSREITYEFETPEAEKKNTLYLNVVLTFEKNSSDARLSQGIEKNSMIAGLRVNGIQPREVEDFYDYGDSSTFYVLESDGVPVGNVFSARDGNKVVLIVLSGMYFDDAEAWQDLVAEKLEKFSAYDPA